MDSVSKTGLAKARKVARAERANYEAARWAALAAGRQARARKTGRARMIREDALDAALEARITMKHYAAVLARMLALPVEPFAGRNSPAAIARLRASGRLDPA